MAKKDAAPKDTGAKASAKPKSQSAIAADIAAQVHGKIAPPADEPAADAKPDAELKPIGDALKPLAMEALGDKQRPRPEKINPIAPEVVRGDNVDMIGHFKTSTKDQLHKLARRYESKKKDLQGHAGDISTMLQKAEETQNLDSWCFKEAMKWDRMSADKLVRRLPIFIKYLQDLEVVKKATAQGDLLAEVERDDAQKQADIEGAKAATALAPARKPTMAMPTASEQPSGKPH